jgi:hypothetical protein
MEGLEPKVFELDEEILEWFVSNIRWHQYQAHPKIDAAAHFQERQCPAILRADGIKNIIRDRLERDTFRDPRDSI